jgi:tetratricopeptide (TPR) repeat protein
VIDGVTSLAAARAALDAGDLGEAQELGARSVRSLTAQSGAGHPDTANAHLLLAAVHEQAGRFGTAREVAATAVSIMDTYSPGTLEAVGILRARAHVVLANLDRILGDLGSARARLTEAMAVAEAELGADHPQNASIHNALGIVGKFSGQFDEAEACYRRALELHDGNPPGQATVLHNLGGLEHERGRPGQGIPWAEQGLALRRTFREPDHPDIAADLGALGSLYLSAGRFDDAEQAYRQAMQIFTAEYEIAVVRGNLAHLQARQGKTAQAEEHYRAALSGKIAALGEQHPDIAVTLHNLGVLLLDTGRADEGRALLDRAESLLTKSFPDDHPRVQAVRRTLATL